MRTAEHLWIDYFRVTYPFYLLSLRNVALTSYMATKARVQAGRSPVGILAITAKEIAKNHW